MNQGYPGNQNGQGGPGGQGYPQGNWQGSQGNSQYGQQGGNYQQGGQYGQQGGNYQQGGQYGQPSGQYQQNPYQQQGGQGQYQQNPYQQQGQSGPGGPSNYPGSHPYQPQEPKKNKTWLWVVIGVLVLAIIGTIVGLAVANGDKDDPDPKPVPTKTAPNNDDESDDPADDDAADDDPADDESEDPQDDKSADDKSQDDDESEDGDDDSTGRDPGAAISYPETVGEYRLSTSEKNNAGYKKGMGGILTFTLIPGEKSPEKAAKDFEEVSKESNVEPTREVERGVFCLSVDLGSGTPFCFIKDKAGRVWTSSAISMLDESATMNELVALTKEFASKVK